VLGRQRRIYAIVNVLQVHVVDAAVEQNDAIGQVGRSPLSEQHLLGLDPEAISHWTQARNLNRNGNAVANLVLCSPILEPVSAAELRIGHAAVAHDIETHAPGRRRKASNLEIIGTLCGLPAESRYPVSKNGVDYSSTAQGLSLKVDRHEAASVVVRPVE